MGQYYLTVNIDKGEFLYPHAFGDGSKLLEFGSSGEGTMLGLAVLLASGNGRGGGDLSRQPVNKGESSFPNAGPYQLGPFERVEDTFESRSYEGVKQKYRIIVPEISGRWAGDRIVVAGDYADEGAFISDEMVKGKSREDLDVTRYENGKNIPLHGPLQKDDLNLYNYADKCFEDISAAVLWGLFDDKYIKKQFEKRDRFAHVGISKDILAIKNTPLKELPLKMHVLMDQMKSEQGKQFLETLVRKQASVSTKKPRRKKCTKVSGKSSRSSSLSPVHS